MLPASTLRVSHSGLECANAWLCINLRGTAKSIYYSLLVFYNRETRFRVCCVIIIMWRERSTYNLEPNHRQFSKPREVIIRNLLQNCLVTGHSRLVSVLHLFCTLIILSNRSLKVFLSAVHQFSNCMGLARAIVRKHLSAEELTGPTALFDRQVLECRL